MRSKQTRRNDRHGPPAGEVLQQLLKIIRSLKLKLAPLRVYLDDPDQRDARCVEERCLWQIRRAESLMCTHAAMVAASFLRITPLQYQPSPSSLPLPSQFSS